jgi:branched-chain amino acid transport system substrate-binding protein
MIRLLGLLGIPLLGMSCSMSTYPWSTCTTNQQCRDAFGWGNVCNLTEPNKGLCSGVKAQARCDTYPHDLIQRRADFQDHIIVGIQFDKSAFNAEMQAARLAVTEVERSDGLDGIRYGLVECTNEESPLYDDLTQDEANVAVSEYLANQVGVVGIIGPATSSRVNSAFLEVEQYGTLLITPSATSPSLTHLDGIESTLDNPGLLWRTVPPDDLQGSVLAKYMIDEGIGSVAVIYEDGAYGPALSSVFMEEFNGSGRQSQGLEYQANSSSSLQSAMDAVRSQDAVLFVSATKTDTITFLENVVANKFGEDKRFFLPDGGQDVEIFDAVDDMTEEWLDRIEGSAPAYEKTVVYDAFSSAYLSQFGEEADQTPYTHRAYDASWLLIYGTAWSHYQEAFSGRINGLGAARGLKMISAGPQVDVGPNQWNSLRANFEVGISVDVRGASGPLDFDENTGETTSAIDIWRMRLVNGRFEIEQIPYGEP